MMDRRLAHAYAVCRGISRRSAKNFYYSFMVLPREKRNALSAVYAFMRHADDIADDPALPPNEKYKQLTTWREQVRAATSGHPTDDPVLFALADAQQNFDIPVELLESLIDGTAQDIHPPDAVLVFKDFDELKRYCYYVASVVGLVTIKIFGYKDPAAEPLAVNTGLAFQLTNIIRDVKEDALLGRVYLPEDDLAQFGRNYLELSPHALQNGFSPESFVPILMLQAQRARELYADAQKLIPLVDHDSQPALWAMVEIYSRLLAKIEFMQFQVFGEKIRLTPREKFGVMAKAFVQRLHF